ncbi:MAG: putative nucleotide-binding protein [Ignavibacteria bacterium]|nr:putative nucleotide-binding protein [Ignavibacteria bacterium]
MRNIRTLNHSIIPYSFYYKAYELCKHIDSDDTAFVAINDYVHGRLWTGDIKLINGLIRKGYTRIVSTDELFSDFTQKENKKHIS